MAQILSGNGAYLQRERVPWINQMVVGKTYAHVLVQPHFLTGSHVYRFDSAIAIWAKVH